MALYAVSIPAVWALNRAGVPPAQAVWTFYGIWPRRVRALPTWAICPTLSSTQYFRIIEIGWAAL
ncbi:hypothetical protein [Marimonas arenosa]|uniref:Uncharacterized protein n=1 Tax=Marimonas arenosa TaxID=1795305 RepID=A0AAE4B3H9_9RHOB|nr:hypothetical protein [Marimonas arenosa]MDQ2088399.1 hypothetical protein [Marimonas arenosa]